MFGQDDKDETTTDDQVQPAVIEPATDDEAAVPVTVTTDVDTDDATEDEPLTQDDEIGTTEDNEDDTTAEVPDETASDEPKVVTDTFSAATPAEKDAPKSDDGLLELKKEALTDLAPLVDRLEQTPEEHFKTVMMLIQATDDSQYVKSAYEAAGKITDDTVRAQALLDIVNEINYFTQAHNKDDK